MPNRKGIYNFINVIIIIISLFILGLIFGYQNFERIKLDANYKIVIIAILFIGFYLIIHLIKMLRFYLIIMKERMPIIRFIRLYIKTTFINITMPIKLGELFRIYCYGYNLKSYRTGFLSVVIERYFDICALVLLLLPIEFNISNKLSWLTILLSLIIVSIAALYVAFPIFYNYLNKFLLLNLSGEMSLRVLEFIEKINDLFLDLKSLVYRRGFLLILLSLIAWTVEYLMFISIASIYGKLFSISDFSGYLNAVLGNGSSNINGLYIVSGSCVLGVLMFLIYFITKEKRHEKKNMFSL